MLFLSILNTKPKKSAKNQRNFANFMRIFATTFNKKSFIYW